MTAHFLRRKLQIRNIRGVYVLIPARMGPAREAELGANRRGAVIVVPEPSLLSLPVG